MQSCIIAGSISIETLCSRAAVPSEGAPVPDKDASLMELKAIDLNEPRVKAKNRERENK